MELEQTETFDYKGNTGFEKRVKIHSSEFHEMQIEVEWWGRYWQYFNILKGSKKWNCASSKMTSSFKRLREF